MARGFPPILLLSEAERRCRGGVSSGAWGSRHRRSFWRGASFCGVPGQRESRGFFRRARPAVEGDLGRARREISSALAETSDSAPTLFVLACISLEAGDLGEARDV